MHLGFQFGSFPVMTLSTFRRRESICRDAVRILHAAKFVYIHCFRIEHATQRNRTDHQPVMTMESR